MLEKFSTTLLRVASHLQSSHTDLKTDTTPEPNLTYPGDDCCYFYDKDNFGG